MKRITLIAALSIMAMTGCTFVHFDDKTFITNGTSGKKHVIASGNIITRNVELPVFESITVSGSADVEFIQAEGTAKVEITGSDNIVEHLETEVENGTLHVRMDSENTYSYKDLKVKVSNPLLKAVKISGAGDFDCEGSLETDSFEIKVSGAGGISLNRLKAETAGFYVSGAGDIDIEDIDCKDLTVSVSGAGDVDIEGHAVNGDFKISGAGDIDISKLKIDGSLDTKVSGIGSISKPSKD